MKPIIKYNIVIIIVLLLTSIPFSLWASHSNTLVTAAYEHRLLYLFLTAFWVLIIVVLIIFFRQSRKKLSKKSEQIQKSIDNYRTKITFFRGHTDELKKEQIKGLHDELAQLEINLKSMQKTLSNSKQTSQQNSILLSNISHTLRTNLNDILGFSSLLGTEFAMNEDEEMFDYSENIRKSGESLLHLINNIIDISRIEVNTMDLKPENCDLKTITQEIIDFYKGLANQKGLKIVFQDDGVPQFSGDGQSLRHIISNLIDNAVRYTEKGFIKIHQAKQDNKISWTIKDTGVGIDKAYLPDIFEPFHRHSLGYSKSTYQGAGLGLPLVKQLLELIHGEITLESHKAVGTTVQILIPFTAPLTEEIKTQQPAPAKPRVKFELKKTLSRLLIADSDRMNNMLIKKMLPKTIAISFAGFEQELLQKLEQSVQQKQLYELIFIEINFQVPAGGIALLKKIPQVFPDYTHTPIIVISSFPELNEENNLMKNGFSAYLPKPVNKSKLYECLNQALYS